MSAPEVAEHYNQVKETGLKEREKSRIFFLRNMNNWVKSNLINEVTQQLRANKIFNPHILDLACGKGGDLLKWNKSFAAKVTMIDVADVSIEQAKGRYQELRNRNNRIFPAEFHVADCTKIDIGSLLSESTQFDLVSCQFALHYSFIDESSARTFLKNAVGHLKPGGVFIGTLPDADRIVWAVRNGVDGLFSNDVCSIKYENPEELADGRSPPLFGAKFHFTLDSQVNCPEFLAYFPLLQLLLEEMDMELMYMRSFPDAIKNWITNPEAMRLLQVMKATEVYPPSHGAPSSEREDAYDDAKEFIKTLGEGRHSVGTISKSEWEAICMYLVFAFRKKMPVEESPAEEAPVTTPGDVKKHKNDDDVTGKEEPELKKLKREKTPAEESPVTTSGDVKNDDDVTGEEEPELKKLKR